MYVFLNKSGAHREFPKISSTLQPSLVLVVLKLNYMLLSFNYYFNLVLSNVLLFSFLCDIYVRIYVSISQLVLHK